MLGEHLSRGVDCDRPLRLRCWVQIESEVGMFLKLMNDTYEILGLKYEMALSTRPEGALQTCDATALTLRPQPGL